MFRQKDAGYGFVGGGSSNITGTGLGGKHNEGI